MNMKKNYLIRNDLAILKTKIKKEKSYVKDDIKVTILKDNSFYYTNIYYSNYETFLQKLNIKKIFMKELKYYLKRYKLNNKKSCLVVGLGNKGISADTLGPLVTNNIIATGYLKHLSIDNCCRLVYTLVPRTLKDTGYEAFLIVKSLVSKIKPDFIIVVDSLISSNIKYLNKVIQITDSGIIPGSGIFNIQTEFSYKTLGIPVIVIGIPLAIEASTIIRDALKIKTSAISFNDGYDFVVCSKDVDEVITIFSNILSEGINKVLNVNVWKF